MVDEETLPKMISEKRNTFLLNCYFFFPAFFYPQFLRYNSLHTVLTPLQHSHLLVAARRRPVPKPHPSLLAKQPVGHAAATTALIAAYLHSTRVEAQGQHHHDHRLQGLPAAGLTIVRPHTSQRPRPFPAAELPAAVISHLPEPPDRAKRGRPRGKPCGAPHHRLPTRLQPHPPREGRGHRERRAERQRRL